MIFIPDILFNICLLYTSTGKYESGNSDCIMIASINNDTKEVRLISVYRDSFLAVDDNDNLRKLNAAYAKGGPTGAVAALNKNLDLDIKEYVAVDFNAVMEVVDAPVSYTHLIIGVVTYGIMLLILGDELVREEVRMIFGKLKHNEK